jgi:signal transduction histidine kinase
VRQTDVINRHDFQRFLLLGLSLSALLLLSAVLVAWRSAHQIDRDTRTFADEQVLAKEAIDDIVRQQTELNDRWLQLARKKDLVRREEILDQLTQSRQQMSRALAFAYERAEQLRESLYQHSHGLLRWTVWLFALCVGLSLLCAFWAVRASTNLFSQLQGQASELSRLQYQFLETQEETARRFSHELHDELGQVLTAVKANLSALRDCSDEARVDDCMVLVDRAIKDVREMSQLLRPTILDDFGLDPALRTLTDSFSQRTGIKVSYDSNVDGRRLRDIVETNVYRIVQEALTNVARHSKATAVTIELLIRDAQLHLTIHDNGHGLTSGRKRLGSGLGLAGMETRARGLSGSLRMESDEGKGLTIEVTCPIES